MKAKEKAEEIYSMYDDAFALMITVDEKTTEKEITDFVKKCSIMCVEEILYSNPNDVMVNGELMSGNT